ncbi:MAG: pentapeptide repeat-containing protein [bacterium]
MPNPDHLARLHEGVDAWNAWRNENPGATPDLSGICLPEENLSGADFSGTNLNGANLTRADLRRANFSDAKLRDTDFSEANLSESILRKADLSDANFERADFTGANLVRANLFRVNLRNAILHKANLKRANIVESHLNGADLSGADLSKVDLFVTNLTEANLCEAVLSHATFFVADLNKANLRNARLWGVELYESTLTQADLTNANLWLGRIIRCDLSDAVVENAIVKDLRVHELKGRPVPPSLLRLDDEGDNVIFGQKAHAVFQQSAIMEIYLNLRLSDLELACFHLHFVNLRQYRVVPDVHLSGQRHEGSSTVLCFQANTYEEIYRGLASLLAPFPRCRAIDWAKSLSNIPRDELTDGILDWVKPGPEVKERTWPLAEHLACAFMGFRNICVSCIKHVGNGPHVQIDVVQDSQKASQLFPPNPSECQSPHSLIVSLRERNEIYIADEKQMKRLGK